MQTETMPEEVKLDVKTPELYCFVCAGNTCRSPMAEAVFKAKYKTDERTATSARLSYGGAPIARNAIAALEKAGIKPSTDNDYPNHISRMLDDGVMAKAKMIICMTSDITMSVICAFPKYASKVYSMPHDISDPFGGDEARYDACLAEITASLDEVFGNGR